MKIAFIACSAKKMDGRRKAKEIYISALFRFSYAYALQKADRIFILSAKYGLIEPEQAIETYNMTLNNFSEAGRKKWAYDVYQKLSQIITPADRLIWLAGENYRKYLMRVLKNEHLEPLKGLGIGSQLHWLKQNIKQ